eukprot:13159966-Alexandrium_andersonii.AAC.1
MADTVGAARNLYVARTTGSGPVPMPAGVVQPPVNVPYGPAPPPRAGFATAGATWGAGAPPSKPTWDAGPVLPSHTSAAKDKRGLPTMDSLPEYPTIGIPGSKWRKLRLYEVQPYIGHSGDVGPEKHLNMPGQVGYKELSLIHISEPTRLALI